MTELAFEYDERLVTRCAQSDLVAAVSGKSAGHQSNHKGSEKSAGTDGIGAGGEQDCLALFRLHAMHFGRSYDAIQLKGLETAWSDDEDQDSSTSARSRFANFVRNVSFIEQHNRSAKSHRVGLNRFSDMQLHEVLQVGSTVEPDRKLVELNMLDDLDDPREDSVGTGQVGVITLLSRSSIIIDVAANLTIGKGSLHKLQPKDPKKTVYVPTKKLRIPTDDVMAPFETPAVNDPDLSGTLLSIKRNKNHDGNDGDAPETLEEAQGGDFANHLNWATTDNPDGVAVVHDAIDQGICGSCWALAATGSLEASASRHCAYEAYQGYRAQLSSTHNERNGTLDANGIAYAQNVEREAVARLHLSIQELLDCDVTADQGCTGGNPLLSFYFIHNYGLASWEDYPYEGHAATCRKDTVKRPVATVKSWGIVGPNHENHMELVLRHIGPIAVGFNGADHSFLSYSGGIYNNRHCHQGANHALLITGYGQEMDKFGNTTKYWIARNSWSTSWGENGYVRITRIGGGKGLPGVCGIARSPSVALGGILLRYSDQFPFNRVRQEGGGDDSNGSLVHRVCHRLGLGPDSHCAGAASWIDGHQALTFGLLGIACFLLALWPLSIDIRRHRRLRRLRELRKKELSEQRFSISNGTTEASALLDLPSKDRPAYGTAIP